MSRCLVCDYPIPDNRERVGARCSSCHEPLYEPPGRMAQSPREGEASCAAHPAMGTVGVCPRCGKQMCETCRTRWRGLILCAACVNAALMRQEGTPSQVYAAVRQAKRSLILAVLVWLIALTALVAASYLTHPGQRSAVVVTFVVFVVLSANIGLAAFAMGQAVAALRVPEVSRVLPLTGLSIAGLYVAVLLGMGLLGLW